MWKVCVHDDKDDNDDDDDDNDDDDDDDNDDNDDNDDDDDDNDDDDNDDNDDNDDDNDDDDPVVPVSWWRAVGVFEQLGRLAGRSVGRPHQSLVCSMYNTKLYMYATAVLSMQHNTIHVCSRCKTQCKMSHTNGVLTTELFSIKDYFYLPYFDRLYV